MQILRTPENAQPDDDLNLKYVDGFTDVTGGVYTQSQADNAGQAARYSLKNMLYTEDWVYITVDAIAQPLSRVPWLVYRKVRTGDKVTYVKNEQHTLNKLLEDPSKTMDATTFKYMLFSEDALMGNALVWYARTLGEMHIIPAENADYDFDFKTTHPERIRVNGSHVNSNSVVLSVADIIHVMRPQTSNKFWGLSPFIPSEKSVLFQRYSSDFLNAFFQRGATPQAILKLEKDANVESATKLLKKFEAAYSGRANSRRTMLLPKGVEFETLDAKIADQQIIDLINMNRENILNTLHIPKHVVSLNAAGSLGSEEFKQALKYFWQACLIPITERFAGKFTRFFKNELGPENVIGFDFSEIEILQDDEHKKALLSKDLLSVMTVNEIRNKVFQLEPVANGDTIIALIPPAPLAPVGTQPVQTQASGSAPPQETAQATAEPGETPEPGAPAKLKNARYFEKRATLIKAHDAVIDSEETAKVKRYAGDAVTLLEGQFDAVEKALEAAFKKKSIEFNEDEFGKEYDALIKKLGDEAVTNHLGVLSATMELGYKHQLSAIFNKENREAIEALKVQGANNRRAILNDRAIEFFKSVSDTTRTQAAKKTQAILDSVSQGMEAQKTVQQIAREVRDYLDQGKENRAMTIARTEVLTAVALGQQAMQEDTKEVIPNLKKIWRCSMDKRVRGNPNGYYKNGPDHWKVHGESIKSGGKYSNGLRYPHDPEGGASNSINCRCRELVIDPEDEQFLDLDPLPGVAEQDARTRPIPRI